MKETGRTDIVQALLTGVPGLTQIGKKPAAGRHAEDQPGRAADGDAGTGSACSPGDKAGFPNGRRLADDVVDIELRVIAGALLPADQGGKQIPLGDGVDQNDKPFRSTFPYVALPDGGLRLEAEADEPAHAAGAPAAGLIAGTPGPSPPWRRPRPLGRRLHMTATSHPPLRSSRCSLSFAAALAAFLARLRGAEPARAGRRPPRRAAPRPAADDRRIAAPCRRRARGARARRRARALAAAYLQKARETGDPASTPAPTACSRARCAHRPGDPARSYRARGARRSRGTTSAAALALARARARPCARALARPSASLVDALRRARPLRRRRARRCSGCSTPSRTSPRYARVSYFRELHGDLAGAVARDAAARSPPAAPTPENVAYVQALLGELELARGRARGRAPRVHRARSPAVPGYAPAEAGLRARSPPRAATSRAPIRALAARWSARLPLPEYVIALGEARARRRPRRRRPRATLALVRAEQRLLAADGVDTDAELARLRGRPRPPGARGRARPAGVGARPSVRSADALGWALTRAGRPGAGLRWARRALRLGSRDPIFRYHAGIAARAAGRRRRRRARLLRVALRAQPALLAAARAAARARAGGRGR